MSRNQPSSAGRQHYRLIPGYLGRESLSHGLRSADSRFAIYQVKHLRVDGSVGRNDVEQIAAQDEGNWFFQLREINFNDFYERWKSCYDLKTTV
jgi:hypothetical protein